MSSRALLPFAVALASAPGAYAQPVQNGDEIVVTAERPRGSVPGDVTPEASFSAQDVRAYGATSIFQLLGALSPQTASASIRGGGAPVVLVNGRRISGFQEIRDLPPDIISRLEVFAEQLAIQYGYSPNQRVVNLILEDSYRADSLEAGGGVADTNARGIGSLEASHVVIDGATRFAVSADYDFASAITEFERGIAAPASGADERRLRTVAPDTESLRANIIFARALSPLVTLNTSLGYTTTNERALLGLDAASALRERTTDAEAWRANAGLDGAYRGWQWTATATGEFAHNESRTEDSVSPASTTSDPSLIDVTVNAGGATINLPAGPIRASARLGVEQRNIESTSETLAGAASAELDRTAPYGRFTLTAPLTSRRRDIAAAFGDIALNATASWSDPSDFSALSSIGYGASWAPTAALRFTLQIEQSNAAPTLEQLGDPLLATPSVSYFDPLTGQDVLITRTTGGNGALLAEDRNDLTVNANWSVTQISGLTLGVSWARNNSDNAIVALPSALPEVEAAFPSRFTRDSAGVLTALDARPINLASRDIETIRWGFAFMRPLGASAEAKESNTGPRADAGERIALGAGGAAAGRIGLSIYHRLRLNDEAVLSPGQPAIDLLARGGLNGASEPRNVIELEGGFFYRGLGMRMSGGWTEGYAIPISTGGALDFSDRTTLNMRVFLNFNSRPDLLERAPYLRGVRLMLSIDNLTDTAVIARDSTGAVADAYQEGYQSPQGRVVQLSLRRQL